MSEPALRSGETIPDLHPEWYRKAAERSLLGERAYERAKRLMDLALSIMILPLLLPVLCVCAIAIKLDSPGPVFFTQERTGRGGRRFRMFKLRTMVRDADALKAQHAHLNRQSYPDFKIVNDPRVTRVGRLLRGMSLDELPQLFNVLRGDMSLVGPRPTSFGALAGELWHTARLEVRPGITGLAQISGRGELDFDERLRLDIAYIRNRTLILDMQILLRTIPMLLTKRGAY